MIMLGHVDFWMPDMLIVFSYLPLCYIIFIVKWFFYSSYIKFKPVTIFQGLSFWSSNLQYISDGIKTWTEVPLISVMQNFPREPASFLFKNKIGI